MNRFKISVLLLLGFAAAAAADPPGNEEDNQRMTDEDMDSTSWGPPVELLPAGPLARGGGEPGLRHWQVHGPSGGRQVPCADPKAAGLATTRVAREDGSESWDGCLLFNDPCEVHPGLAYRVTLEARGEDMTFGVFEYTWKYGATISGSPGKEAALSPEWRTYTWWYRPTSAAVTHVRPFVHVTGWLKRAELRSASFAWRPGTGTVSIRTDHFVTTPGGTLSVQVTSSHYPVEIRLFGPDGTSGKGGAMGGSSAFCDHYRQALTVEGSPGTPTTATVQLPPDAIEGSYRLVAVNSGGGATATAGFTVRPEAGLRKLLSVVERIDLREGTRIVFLGDSLTANFPGRNYPALIQRAFHWRFGKKVEVINAGAGGDDILRIEKRLAADVLQRRPTHVFIFEGANDCKRRYDPATGTLGDWAVPAARYEASLRRVIGALTEKGGIEVIVATCAPADREIRSFFEEDARTYAYGLSFFGLPEEISRIVSIQKNVAADFGLDVVDTHERLARYEDERALHEGTERLHVDDGVHLSEYGNREVAGIFLEVLASR